MPPTSRTSYPSQTTPQTLLLLHSLPPSVFLGLDLLSVTATPNFHGIKNLGPGYHFLYSSSDASLSIRHGQWFHVTRPGQRQLRQQKQQQQRRQGLSSPAQLRQRQGEVEDDSSLSIWRWSREDECLRREENVEVGRARLPADLRGSLGSGLLDYGESGDHAGNADGLGSGGLVKGWGELTGYITEELLERMLGDLENGEGKGATQDPGGSVGGTRWTISSVSSAPQDVDEIPGLTPSEARIEGEKQLNFLPIDLKKTWREGAVGRERTDAARDKSWYLKHLIHHATIRDDNSVEDRKVGAAQLLGELQVCFLMVLTLANWSCLQQWKRLLAVLLGCRSAMVEVEEYFVTVLELLQVQLRHCDDVEGGLFDFKEDGAGWLRDLMTQLRKNVEEVFVTSVGESLRTALSKAEEYLCDKYGWQTGQDLLKRGLLELEDGERVDMDMNGADEEDETGEYAPVVVKLDE